MSEARVRLHVNVDHVATLRQARGTAYPDPVEAALTCERAGADGVTVHLREDRRHIQDRDVKLLRDVAQTVLNLEMALTAEMIELAQELRPDIVTLVPERREERTTEGGLDVVRLQKEVIACCETLENKGIRVHLFVAPDEDILRAGANTPASGIELHTGEYAYATLADVQAHINRLATGAREIKRWRPDMIVAAGHGLTRANVPDLVASVPELTELNIGHALVSDAVFLGLAESVIEYRTAIRDGESQRKELHQRAPQ